MAASIKRVAAAGAFTVALLSTETQDAGVAYTLMPAAAALEVKQGMEATSKLENQSEIEQKTEIKTEAT